MRRRLGFLVACLVPAAVVLHAACGNAEFVVTPQGTQPDAGGGTGGEGDPDAGNLGLPDASGDAQGDGCVGEACSQPEPACGDGEVDPGEACDDANGVSGDGCAANCDAIEADWVCPMPGQPCVYTVACGDGKIGGAEQCDDANATAGDGCGATCQVEAGWICPEVAVACEAAVCGDGLVVGKEKCDDGNAFPGDGCSDLCVLEQGFTCPTPAMPCVPTVCGDGIAEGTEPCDDGNNDMGDGCTPFCDKEPDCTLGACASTCGDGLKLPSDNEECEDGNTTPGDGCSADCKIEPGYECNDVPSNLGQLDLPIVLRDFQISHPDFEGVIATDKGIVTTALGANGKPVYANPAGTTPTTSGQADFDQWYVDVAGVNFTILQTMTLAMLPTGEFQFSDGTFFPIDGLGFGNEGNSQNFHFTSEVRYWFEYKGGEQLFFTGDDDVWVFVNKTLAIDLGGVHGAQSASITLDAAAAATLGLVVGEVYEIVVFQAERHTTQSNYQLTLSNFDNTTSICNPVCGDGIKTPDEQCDDGVNDGSYGSCTPDCKKGPYCGDAILQAADGEECDDGVNLTPYGGCGPGCKQGGFCGDGVVDSAFGEACDDGTNDGGYGECAPGCLLGPHCGDGVLQAADGEECDDGNKVNGDGCSAACSDRMAN